MAIGVKNILVLCTGNSCRSQMAEGFLRSYSRGQAQIYSAGVETHGVNALAIKVMAEVGIDISKHTSNNVEEYVDLPFSIIITVCDHAKEVCPYIPGNALRVHHTFPDPAKVQGSEEEILNAFRKTRDLIAEYCKDFAGQYILQG